MLMDNKISFLRVIIIERTVSNTTVGQRITLGRVWLVQILNGKLISTDIIQACATTRVTQKEALLSLSYAAINSYQNDAIHAFTDGSAFKGTMNAWLWYCDSVSHTARLFTNTGTL